MDSLTHIYFAHKLLIMSGRDTSAAVCSLFPQIDREPAYFHRMYGHPFFQIKRLAKIGTGIYKTGTVQEELEGDYAASRFLHDRPRMRSFAETFECETRIKLSPFDPDFLSVLIGYVSHTYQDIFNNPMQAFLPQSVYPCGKWELWSELDPIEFRTILYYPENISAFRQEFFNDRLWSIRLDGAALIKAMVNRTAVASIVQIPRSTIDSAFESFGLEEVAIEQVKEAEEFLIEHEQLLSKLIRKYSAPSTQHKGAANYPVTS
ncbi:MAG TPA: hypothetical protein VFA09_26915 [Ktedonobacteraceae bacterium]|nr:hypothetical protein [Ktedonobacteraceae bacterium]